MLAEHVISAQGISVDPAKVEAMLQWERPKTITHIRSFVGLDDYYWRFIEFFSKVVVLGLIVPKFKRGGGGN